MEQNGRRDDWGVALVVLCPTPSATVGLQANDIRQLREIAKRRRQIRMESGQPQKEVTAYQATAIAKAFLGEVELCLV